MAACVDLYAFAGQSNILGWGVGAREMQALLSRRFARPKQPQRKRVWLFEPLGEGCGSWGAYKPTLQTAASCAARLSRGERAALELRTASGGALDAVAALSLATGGGCDNIGIVKLGHGSTSMEQWSPSFPTGFLRQASVASVAQLPAAARAAICLACTPLLAAPRGGAVGGAASAHSCGESMWPTVAGLAELTLSAPRCAEAINQTQLWRYDVPPRRWTAIADGRGGGGGGGGDGDGDNGGDSGGGGAAINLYDALEAKLARANASAAARFGGGSRFRAFVWMQGENELNGLQPLLPSRDELGVSADVRRWLPTLARVVSGARAAVGPMPLLVLRTRWRPRSRRRQGAAAQALLAELAAQCRAHAHAHAHSHNHLNFSSFVFVPPPTPPKQPPRSAAAAPPQKRPKNHTIDAAECGLIIDAYELRRSQMGVASSIADAHWLDTDTIEYRNVHLSASGHVELGRAVAERLRALRASPLV